MKTMTDPRCGKVSRANDRDGHCTNERSVAIQLTEWNGDPLLGSEGDTHLDECPVDGGGVPPELFADLVGARSSFVHVGRVRPPSDVCMFTMMLKGSQWSQVRWCVVGPVVVDVVNLLIHRDPAVDHPVLVGFDLLVGPHGPAKSDVAMGGRVSPRGTRRYLLARRQIAGGDLVSGASAGATEPLMGGAGDQPTAGSLARLGDDDHGLILQVRALCHRTFSGENAFRAHQHLDAGVLSCDDPETTLTAAGVLKFGPRERPGTTDGVAWGLGPGWSGPTPWTAVDPQVSDEEWQQQRRDLA